MPTCTKCGGSKEISEFYKDRNSKSGHTPYCKVCILKIRNVHYTQNKDKILQKAASLREKGPLHGPLPEYGRCSHCKQTKLSVEFGENRMRPQLLRGECYTCDRQKLSKLRELNREKVNARARDYYAENREKILKYRAEYRVANSHKEQARRRVSYAVERGYMQRGACEVCGNPDTEGHHDDYSKPLDVKWLCGVHHARLHGVEKRKVLNAS